MVVAKTQSQSADFGQSEETDFTENPLVFDGYRLRLIPSCRRRSNMFDFRTLFYFSNISEKQGACLCVNLLFLEQFESLEV